MRVVKLFTIIFGLFISASAVQAQFGGNGNGGSTVGIGTQVDYVEVAAKHLEAGYGLEQSDFYIAYGSGQISLSHQLNTGKLRVDVHAPIYKSGNLVVNVTTIVIDVDTDEL